MNLFRFASAQAPLRRPLNLLLCGAAALFCVAATAQPKTGWTLVWSDEFSGADGSSPDSTKWGFDTGGSGWGNNELEYYTTRTNNARIENGHLVIEARQESYGGRDYTSARLLTRGKWSWTYGRMEARIKIPRGQGIWPAFWMLGTNIDSVGWPTCGEIDIMENIGKEPGTIHGTIHGPGYSGGNGIGGPSTLSGVAAFADDFHLFAIEWQTNHIRWLVDGQEYFSVSPANLPGGTQWVFNRPQFLLLNLAVGGNWPGNPDATTTFPQQMVVDYVRVYAPTTVTSCTGNLLTNPGFESGNLAGWTAYGSGGNTFVAPTNSLPAHTGGDVFKVYGQFTGGANYSGVYQDVLVTPGANYMADGWALTPNGDNLAGGNLAWLEVTFRNDADTLLSLYRSEALDASTTPGLWQHLLVTNQFDPATYARVGAVSDLVAPPGATKARCQIVFQQPLTAAGAALFDDLNLATPDSSEATVAIQAAQSGPNLTLSFPTLFGLNYAVRFKRDLGDDTWLTLTNVPGDGSVKAVADLLGDERRFYRVVPLCN